MTPQHLLEDGNGTDAGSGLEEGNNLGLEDMFKRIGPATAVRFDLL